MLLLWLRTARKTRSIQADSVIESIRAVGELTVFRIVAKEIATQHEHMFGDFGKNYLNWLWSGKKAALVFQFVIDFKYDLRSKDFEISEESPGSFLLRMPKCAHDISLKDMKVYDEQGSHFLPEVLPKFVGRILGSRVSEDEKNKLIEAAQQNAIKLAEGYAQAMSAELEKSVRQTLEPIGRAFGAEHMRFDFEGSVAGRTRAEASVAAEQPLEAGAGSNQ
jgi:hypothetical protein